MEHEVFVPVQAAAVQRALADPAQVALAVPGLQRDASDDAGLAGRLRLRFGGHTITYRGTLALTRTAEPDAVTLDAAGAEVRGGAEASFRLSVRVAPVDGGAVLVFAGSGDGKGRVAELAASEVETGVRRALNRFAEALAAGAVAPGSAEGPGPGEQAAAAEAEGAVASAEEVVAEADVSDVRLPGEADAVEDAIAAEEIADGIAEIAEVDEVSAVVFEPYDEFDDVSTAEAAHARRTMIGRSAEEVDHAPPRGRYMPVAAPAGGSAVEALRWAGPVVVAVVASAVVAGRILRRRR
ncbi:CoxG family protein [Streptomyces sp. NPDC060194]|uniref:CoxG family protein n=1 Tax=Streptomyces sp. NPDC060194 TaxID=3347069 RepID=UPI0036474FF1